MSFLNCAISEQARMSKNLQVESSDPVPNDLASGNRETELISDSCPRSVMVHFPVRISQTLAKVSQEPEINMLGSTDGRIETDMTSPSWSLNVVLACPNSISQSIQVLSPEEVKIEFSVTNLLN